MEKTVLHKYNFFNSICKWLRLVWSRSLFKDCNLPNQNC